MRRIRSIRARRKKRTIPYGFDLQITSLLDILVILLVFLLKSSVATLTNFNLVSGVELPVSQSNDIPPETLVLIVAPESMTFDSIRVLDFQQPVDPTVGSEPTYQLKPSDLDEGGRRIVPLYDALIAARQREEILRAKSKLRGADGKPLPFSAELAIQADKRINYDLLRKIMYTAAASGYRLFRFFAMKKEI